MRRVETQANTKDSPFSLEFSKFWVIQRKNCITVVLKKKPPRDVSCPAFLLDNSALHNKEIVKTVTIFLKSGVHGESQDAVTFPIIIPSGSVCGKALISQETRISNHSSVRAKEMHGQSLEHNNRVVREKDVSGWAPTITAPAAPTPGPGPRGALQSYQMRP